MMSTNLPAILLLCAGLYPLEAAHDDELYCIVCRTLITEAERQIALTDPKKIIDLGGRVQADGAPKSNKKPYKRSMIQLTELLETICEDFDDFAQGHWKDTGERDLMPIMVNGAMNPRFAEFEIQPDPDLNKGVKQYCQTMVEEEEDELMEFLSKEHKDPSHEFCYHKTTICNKAAPTNKQEL